MCHPTRRARENRIITVDFRSEATYCQLLGDGKACLACVLACVLALGLQRKHKATCSGGGCLTRHAHSARVRLAGVTIWRIQCTTCKLPVYFLVDENPSCCLTDKVYLPTMVTGRVLWHLGYTTEARAAAFTASYQVFQRAASQQEPSYRVRGVLTDGCDSTTGNRVRQWVQAKQAGWYAGLADPPLPVPSTL